MRRLLAMPAIGTSGTSGVRKGRFTCGFVRRMIMTAAQTMTNAMSVPMFTRSARILRGKSAATVATNTPVRIVALCGVRKTGWTAAKNERGISPSRAMARRMRAWLNRSTRRTLVIPTTAPSEMKNTAMGSPRTANARAGRQVADRAGVDPGVRAGVEVDRCPRPASGQGHPEEAEERDEVVRPAVRHGARGDRVLEDQVPADDPGEELAERGVGVGVGAARHRHHRRKLAVAERGERTAESRDAEGE